MRKKAENLFVILVVLFFVGFFFKDDIIDMLPKDYGNKLEHGKSILYYKNVTQEDAQKLLDYLINQEIFDYDKGARGQITKEDGVYKFKLLAKKEAISKDDTDKSMTEFASFISADVFNYYPVEVHLTDKNFETMKSYKSLKAY